MAGTSTSESFGDVPVSHGVWTLGAHHQPPEPVWRRHPRHATSGPMTTRIRWYVSLVIYHARHGYPHQWSALTGAVRRCRLAADVRADRGPRSPAPPEDLESSTGRAGNAPRRQRAGQPAARPLHPDGAVAALTRHGAKRNLHTDHRSVSRIHRSLRYDPTPFPSAITISR
jgi:hypothetical protein